MGKKCVFKTNKVTIFKFRIITGSKKYLDDSQFDKATVSQWNE